MAAAERRVKQRRHTCIVRAQLVRDGGVLHHRDSQNAIVPFGVI